MIVYCMLLPHNPYRLPQHYKRQVCGPSCSCKHRYFWVSPIFEHYFCLNYMDTVRHWQPFWSRKSFHFIGQCWYFNPQWTPECAIIKTSSVRAVLVSWEKCAVTKCLRVYQCLWRGYILAPEWKTDLQGSWSIASHSAYLNRSEQNSAKPRHTVCDVFRSHSAI
jgi:hypothetical protein